jgi:hydrogenase maturation protease
MLPEYTQQAEPETATIVIVGIGNYYRGDDATGLIVARELRAHVPMQVKVRECTGASLELIDMWAGASDAILVDAVCSGADPGTIYRFEVGNRPLPSFMFHYSTHDFNVADAIEFARMLGKLPPHLVVYGVEGADFEQGVGLSEDVIAAIETVTARVLKYVLGRVDEMER